MEAQPFRTEVVPVEDLPGAETIRVSGSATRDDATALRDRLLDAIHASDAQRFVIELSKIDQIDTAGAAVLFEAWSAARKQGSHALLCSPSESVLRMFRLAGLEEILGSCCANPQETWHRLTA